MKTAPTQHTINLKKLHKNCPNAAQKRPETTNQTMPQTRKKIATNDNQLDNLETIVEQSQGKAICKATSITNCSGTTSVYNQLYKATS